MSDRDDHHASETEPLSAEDLAWLQSVRRGQDRQRQVTLQLFHRDGVHEVLLAEGSGVVLGRDYPADEIVNDASLSREHAHVELLDGAVWVQDLGSTNGTWVDGERIEQRAQVALGQSLALGSVTAVIVPEEGARRGRARLDSHDRFVRSLDAEIERAHAFSRSLALLMIRGEDRRRGQLGSWLPAVRRKLRPFDQAALYSGDTLELLLPETTEEAARATAAALIQHSEPLVCGVAVFPGHASSAEELVDAARSAVQHAFGDEPIQAALPSARKMPPEDSEELDRQVLVSFPAGWNETSPSLVRTTRPSPNSSPLLRHFLTLRHVVLDRLSYSRRETPVNA